MHCYMCAIEGTQQNAVATCKFCSVGLCLEHVAEDYAEPYPMRYTCNHPRPSELKKIANGSNLKNQLLK